MTVRVRLPAFRAAVIAAAIAIVACKAATEVIPGPALSFAKLALGLNHTCGLTTDGEIYCWGVIHTPEPFRQAPTPVLVSEQRPWLDIAVGSNYNCALASDSTAFCWGTDHKGVFTQRPTQISSVKFKSLGIRLYDRGACALTSSGDIYCWGKNDYGQSAVGHLNEVAAPTRIASSLVASAVGVSGAHGCMLSDGAAYCWGYNGQGQLGRLDTALTCDPVLSCAFPLPAPVRGNLTFSSITVAGGFTCAITLAKSAYCWGDNLEGQGGSLSSDTCIPIIPCNPSPTPVAGGLAFAELQAGAWATCGVTPDGRGYCWGNNEEGQLGTGDRSAKPQPTAVQGSIDFRVIYPGIRHSCAITVDDRAYCWGNNIARALGIGTAEGLFTAPVAVAPAAR